MDYDDEVEDEGGLLMMMGMNDDEEEEEEVQDEAIQPTSASANAPADGTSKDDDSDKNEENKIISTTHKIPIGRRVKARYNDDEGSYYFAFIRSHDADGTYTIRWEDGSLQSGTLESDIEYENIEQIDQQQLQQRPAEQPKQEVQKKVEDELWLAARRGSIGSVKRFVEVQSIHFNEDGGSGRTPFYWSVLCGHLECAEYFIVLGASDDDGTAFAGASKPEMRELLRKYGMDKDQKKKIVIDNGNESKEVKETLSSPSPAPVEVSPVIVEGRKSIHRSSFANPRRRSSVQPKPASDASNPTTTTAVDAIPPSNATSNKAEVPSTQPPIEAAPSATEAVEQKESVTSTKEQSVQLPSSVTTTNVNEQAINTPPSNKAVEQKNALETASNNNNSNIKPSSPSTSIEVRKKMTTKKTIIGRIIYTVSRPFHWSSTSAGSDTTDTGNASSPDGKGKKKAWITRIFSKGS